MTITEILQEARDQVDADITSYGGTTLLRRVNVAYEDVVSKILGCDGLWQFDDSNYTSFPIATTDMVNSQNDYQFDTTHLEILRAEVKDSAGLWSQLIPIDISQVDGAI